MPVAKPRSKRAKTSTAGSRLKKSPARADPREALNMRIRPELRILIDCAAELAGKNRTDFVLDAARRAAQDTVLDQKIVSVGPESYAAFLALLDAPPKPNDRLRKTMQTQPVWA